MKITFNASSKQVKLIGLIFLLLVYISCKKGPIEKVSQEEVRSSVLSKYSSDFSDRLNEIKKTFYSKKLDRKLTSTIGQDLVWTPDWKNSKSQIVNDTVSYIFYPLLPTITKDGKAIKVNELGSKTYLIVKNEKEFYRGRYYHPSGQINISESDRMKKILIENFTGDLLLSNLEKKQSYIINYENGFISKQYHDRGIQAIRNKTNSNGKISYYEESCWTVMKNCSYTSYGCGYFDLYVSPYCLRPSDNYSTCGYSSTWELADYQEETVCHYTWFPDPPYDPGTGGGSGSSPSIEIDKAELTSKFPCASKLIDKLEQSEMYNQMVIPFSSQQSRPTLTWNATPLAWNNNGEYAGGNTGVTPGSSTGASSNINLNSNLLQNSSQLLIAAVSIHETYHAYINYMFAFDISPTLFNKSQPSYMAGLYQYIIYTKTGSGNNYVDHYNMLTSQFDNFTNILMQFGGGTYNVADCRKALLFGMNNPGPNPDFGQAEFITKAYNDLLNKYGFTSAEINNFNISQLNSSTDKLPTNCP